jgi:hypothetical protein
MNAIMTRTKVPKRRNTVRDGEARPNKLKDAYPDFALLRRSIFGKRKPRTSGASLASEERGTN